MSQFTLEAKTRDRAGKGVARTLRREGRVPAVIYGDKKEPVLISLDANNVNLQFRKGGFRTNLCALTLDGAKHLVLAREVGLHPVTDVVEHVDFMRVSAKTRVQIKVAVHLVGEDKSPAVKQKAQMTWSAHEVEIECAATDLPEYIEFDVSDIEIGQPIHADHAKLPKDVKILHAENLTIGTYHMAKVAAEPAAAAPAAAAKPAAKAAGK